MQSKVLALGVICILLLAGGSVVYLDTRSNDDCGPGQHVERASTPVGANNTLSFAALNETQRAVFRDALRCNARFGPASPWLNHSRLYNHSMQEPFRTNDYVEFEGNIYAIAFSRGAFFSGYRIIASVTQPPERATVTKFEEVPPHLRAEMRELLTTGNYSAPPGKWEGLPDSFQTGGYIRYRNNTYELSAVVADGRLNVMTVEEVS